MMMTVQYDPASRPHIQTNHIDGPLLFLRDGRLHWLTWRERLQLWLGRTDAYKLERKWWGASQRDLAFASNPSKATNSPPA